uniref:Uncharacterized protein LOC105648813 n=1 Tax=Rhizophora mucronata TaxID=61149 RepID=A0A2P2MDL8_RHIMU
MFTKLFQKNPKHPPSPPPSQPQAESNVSSGNLRPEDINPRVILHYGIPSTASLLAFDPIQSLLAIGTLDGRIKVIGGNNIEGLLISPKNLPFKNLEFLQNQGFLASVSSENEIQIWDLKRRQIASSLQWECSVTAFSIIHGSSYMYVGDEYGMVSVLKYEAEEVKLMQLPYHVPMTTIAEASVTSLSDHHSVVGALPQPSSQGNRLLIAFQDGLIILWDVSEDKVILVRGNKDLHLKSGIVADSNEDMGHDGDGLDDEQVEKEISSLCWASDNGSVLAVGYVDGDIMLWDLSTSVRGQQDEKSSNNVVKLQLSSGDKRIPVIVLHWSANRSHDCCGQLFVYGGDTVGSEEVLTILSLDWSYGLESLKCVGRTDLTLNGSFADMVLSSRADISEPNGAFILTSPGQLDFYDDSCLSSLISQQEIKTSVGSIQYQMVVPTMEPVMTVGKFSLIHKEWKSSGALSEVLSAFGDNICCKTSNNSCFRMYKMAFDWWHPLPAI